MLRPPSRRLFWILFGLPWLIVLLLPALRWQLRVQAVGSEYGEDISLIPVTLPAAWLFPRNLAPTWKQLQHKAKSSPDWRIAVDLKTPRQRGDSRIEAAEIYRVSHQALKQKPSDAYLLSVRLKAALAFVKDNRLEKEMAFFKLRQTGSAFGLWQDYPDGKNFPAAGRVIWNNEETHEFDSKTDVSRVGGPTKVAASEALKVAFAVAQRGAALEPDNAYWPWQQSYLLLLLRRDEQAQKHLLRAAQLKRFDDYRVEDFRQTLMVAGVYRRLLIEEKLSLQARRSFQDLAFPQREDLWLLQARRAERKGDVQKSLTLSSALATIGALRLQSARTNSERRSCLLLQCLAWQGGNRRPLKSVARKGKPANYYEVRDLKFISGYVVPPPTATSSMFARRFAADARKARREDLAQGALQQGIIADREANKFHRYGSYGLANSNGEFRLLPALPAVFILKWASQMTLIQLQITLVFWCVLSLILWKRLWFLGRYAARGWRILSMMWRTRDKPLWDEEVPVLEQENRDENRSFWFASLWIVAAIFGICCWNLPLFEWYPEVFRDDFNKAITIIPAMISLLLYPIGPVLFGLLWCGGAALRRYYRLKLPKVWRDDVETTALHAPPSVIPLASAFMVWSLTVFALLCWLGCLLAYVLPRGSLDFNLPPLWAFWVDSPMLSLPPEPEMWAAMGFFATMTALIAWLWKWSWQLHLRRRLPALFLGLTWWRQTLGAWLIVASWLYLVLLILALPARRASDLQFEKMLQNQALELRAFTKASTNVARAAF